MRFELIAVLYEGKERRKKRQAAKGVEPVVLTKKYAEVINDVPLTNYKVGERICLKRQDAEMLLAEGWASPVPEGQRRKTPDISC